MYFKLFIFVAIFAAATYVFHNYNQGCMCQSKARLYGKVAIVTGANSGIGRQVTVELARRGARVIMACRSMERGENAARYIAETTGK